MSKEARVGIEIWRVKVPDTGELYLYKELSDAILMAQFLAAQGYFVEIL